MYAGIIDLENYYDKSTSYISIILWAVFSVFSKRYKVHRTDGTVQLTSKLTLACAERVCVLRFLSNDSIKMYM